MSDTIASILNTPPDWNIHTQDLLCPLCGYNLRGLTVARCPECGFAFTWQELIEAEKNKHLYLFEHGTGGNIKSFWKTYWRTWRFWNDLNPAQPVRFLRLMIYWVITCSIIAAFLALPKVNQIYQTAHMNMAYRSSSAGSPSRFYGRLTPAQISRTWPVPSEWVFWQQALTPNGFRYSFASRAQLRLTDCSFGWLVFLVCWPWTTLISLLIFRLSMRQAKIRTVHLVRTLVYSCDFGLLLTIAFAVTYYADPRLPNGWTLLWGAGVCAAITTYRLTIAFQKYLRVHRPLATVLASQAISFLIVFVVLAPIADFSRRV
jgi:hypothetical protein